LLLPAALLFVLSCPSSSPKSVASVYVLGNPQYASDFSTSGKFSVDALPVAADGSVIELSDTNEVQILIDSVSPPGNTYTVAISGVAFSQPNTNQTSYGVLLDGSYSMKTNDSAMLRVSGTKEFIRRLLALNSDNLASIADFGIGATTDSSYYFRKLQPYVKVSDTIVLFEALDSITAEGNTPLYTSLNKDLRYTAESVSASAYTRRLLLLTDGYDDGSYPADSFGSVVANSLADGIPIYIIGLSSDVNADTLLSLANSTHGIYAQVDSAGGLEAAFQAMGAGASQGYNSVSAKFSSVPASGTTISGHMIVFAGGTSASGTLKFRIP
jgi:hypothetical protein